MLEFARNLDRGVRWLRVLQTLLCLGLNLAIPLLRRHPRLTKLAIVVVALNEIRGLYFAYEILLRL